MGKVNNNSYYEIIASTMIKRSGCILKKGLGIVESAS